MGTLVSRSVEIKISNRTQNITLRNPRTYFECGNCHKCPVTELLPDSSGTCLFLGSEPFWGVAGVLVYESDSFTLAIYFSNPIDYNKFSMELGLELSPGKVRKDKLPDIYTRMAKGTYSSSCLDAEFIRVIVDESHRIARLSDGHVKVTATMSYSETSTLNVVLEDQ